MWVGGTGRKMVGYGIFDSGRYVSVLCYQIGIKKSLDLLRSRL